MYIMDKCIVSLFLEAKNLLGSHMCFQHKPTMKYFVIKYFYKLFGKKIKKYVNYDLIAQDFNKIYFFKNYIKCLVFFYNYPLEIQDKIIDIGCGAGTASISYAQLALARNNRKVKTYLYDKSKKQLNLAEQFLRNLSISYKIEYTKSFKIQNNVFHNLVIFSYFICEQNEDFIKIIFENRKKFLKGFVIIDYKTIIEKICNYFNMNNDYNITSIYRCYATPESVYKIIEENEVNVYGCYYYAEK